MSYQFPAMPGLQVGGRFFNAAELKKLMSEGVEGGILVAGTSGDNYGTNFCLSDGTLYQAPSDMYVQAVVAGCQVAGENAYRFFLGYSDTPVTFNSTPPGTNQVYYGNGATTTNIPAGMYNEETKAFALSWTIPSGKYPFFQPRSGDSWCQLYFLL